MKSTLALLLVLLILAIGTAYVPECHAAQEEDIRKVFEKLDRNRDKRLSEQEFVGEGSRKDRLKARKQFRRLDKNDDKKLSMKEFSER